MERAEEAGASESGGVFSAPLAGTDQAILELVGGAHTVHVRGESGMAELFRARFESGGVKVRVNQDTVTIRSCWQPFGGRPEGDVLVNSAVPWAIRLRGGSNRITADLVQVTVTKIEMSGGMNDAEFRLEAPDGTVPVRISGGASRLSFHRPADIPVRLHVRGGMTDLRLDGQRLRSGSGGTWETPGSEDAADFIRDHRVGQDGTPHG